MDKRIIYKQKTKRLIALQSKGFFTKSSNDFDEIRELKKELKKLEENS